MVAARGGVERCGVARCESVRACAALNRLWITTAQVKKDLCERRATAFLATASVVALRGE
jgi:hypothetical protein